jgi:pimeloyl-ACP methyl ester carboxylesterase
MTDLKKKTVKEPKNDTAFVLFHGAGYGSWIWDTVIPNLIYPSIAIDFPGRDDKKVANIKDILLEDYIASAHEDIANSPAKKLILVGHSFSGSVALALASKMPERIHSIVLMSAAAPKSGSPYLSLLPGIQQFVMKMILKFTSGRPPESAIRTEAKGVDEETIKMVLEKYCTESPHIWTDPVTWNIPTSIPVYYIRDKSDFPSEQSIKNSNPIKVYDIDTGHLPMLSKSEEVLKILNEIASK